VPVEMLQPFTPAHFNTFLQLAAAEGWITDRRELEFLFRSFPWGCLLAIDAAEPAAFITAMRYAASAWIGNLLVAPACRRQGFGRALMEEVLQRLDSSGCETVWLTASSEGAHLYRTLGFVAIDSVQRWRACGTLAAGLPCAVDLEHAAVVDRMGWGDSRAPLFSGRQDCTGWLLGKDSFLRCLPAAGGLQLGPWGSLAVKGAAKLLELAMKEVRGSGEIFLDVPQGNRAAGRLLRAHGFAQSGATLLMYRGRVPAYRPEFVYSLASMGSYG
jgi:GNAT superfamily N-acetyltransferase